MFADFGGEIKSCGLSISVCLSINDFSASFNGALETFASKIIGKNNYKLGFPK